MSYPSSERQRTDGTDPAALFSFLQSLDRFPPRLMSYRFRHVWTRFAIRGPTLPYFSGSSRTASDNGTGSLGRPAGRADCLARRTSVRQVRLQQNLYDDGHNNRTDWERRFLGVYRPDRHQGSRRNRPPRGRDI